jgi:CRISPR/Cas system-associated protein Cas5 (RAMP superfamily)
MRTLNFEVSNMQELHHKLNAYKVLFGEPTKITITGVLDTKEGDTAFLSCPHKVLSVGKKYLVSIVDGERIKMTITQKSNIELVNYRGQC